MTTAASVAWGRSSKSPVRKSRATTVRPAASIPETCVRAPADALTAVLERLPLTTMPLDRPEARFGAAEGDQLAVGVDGAVVASRVRLGRPQSLRERDQHHADAARGQLAGVREPDVGQAERAAGRSRSTRRWAHRGRTP